MNQLLVELEKVHVDVKKTIGRFMDNEEIYLKFLKRFPQEPPFYELKNKINNNVFDHTTLTAAHTLKGLTANLGMDKIYLLTENLMNKIKNSEFDCIPDLLNDIEDNYTQICNTILDYSGENS